MSTASQSDLAGRDGEAQLEFAAAHGWVLFTFNVSDFHRLHIEWVGSGREHSGMILAPQQRYSVGEQLRRILRLRAANTPDGMRNRIEFLSNWG